MRLNNQKNGNSEWWKQQAWLWQSEGLAHPNKMVSFLLHRLVYLWSFIIWSTSCWRKSESMELDRFQYGDCICGHGYDYQASQKKDIQREGRRVPTLAPKSSGYISPKTSVPKVWADWCLWKEAEGVMRYGHQENGDSGWWLQQVSRKWQFWVKKAAGVTWAEWDLANHLLKQPTFCCVGQCTNDLSWFGLHLVWENSKFMELVLFKHDLDAPILIEF